MRLLFFFSLCLQVANTLQSALTTHWHVEQFPGSPSKCLRQYLQLPWLQIASDNERGYLFPTQLKPVLCKNAVKRGIDGTTRDFGRPDFILWQHDPFGSKNIFLKKFLEKSIIEKKIFFSDFHIMLHIKR